MAESLRDQLAANYDKITADTGGVTVDTATPVESAVPAIEPAAPPSSKIVEAPKPAAASTEDRPRDAEGKFIAKADAPKVEAKTAAVVHKAPQAAPGTPQAQAALPAATAKPRPPRPSSWKKEYWDQWEKLDPALAEYLHTRESQYASGVSTYKAEAEAAKPLMDAMQQFIPELKQHNIEPTRWITELGHVHRMLALGTPAQKLQTLNTVLRAYGVPVQALFDQNAQQQYLQQGQFQQPLAPVQQERPLTREEAQKLWQEQFVQVDADREIQRFAADTEKHPHYEALRETMSGLLQANLAEDLESAYEKACKLNPEISAAILQQEQQKAEEQRKQAEAARVSKAKGKAVSPASATPSGPGSEEKPKGLRSSLESAFDSVVAGGRV